MPLPEQIAKLLSLPEDGAEAPSLATIESTLTDGYAAALALDAERLRIERQLRDALRDGGDATSPHEVAGLSERLDTAAGELAGLRSLLRSLQARRRLLRRSRV
jgi:hypothetical protein